MGNRLVIPKDDLNEASAAWFVGIDDSDVLQNLEDDDNFLTYMCAVLYYCQSLTDCTERISNEEIYSEFCIIRNELEKYHLYEDLCGISRNSKFACYIFFICINIY